MSRRARALMLQGTASHVGKTTVVAGLCRVFRDAELSVAPFKAQNMALNAYVTRDGGEIGWAQAMQAEAAGLEPTVDMNPVLLKPQTGGSQVIVHGKVWATLSAAEYYRRREELWQAVAVAYRRLAEAHDLIVIEGAGSPAEPNLMTDDITNMAVARLARAPVVLVGDIDRGGVFASLIGTLALLPREDQRRVRGFLINKFRGDRDLLVPALDFLERRTRRRVLGVLPYLPDLRLPEEDSVALDEREHAERIDTQRAKRERPGERSTPRLAVVRLPHIANFTDFAPLQAEPTVRLVYARHPEELAGAALVILPGSKDTLADLRWLRRTGFAEALLSHLARGGRLAGICGGFQMLGEAVDDPEGLEAGGGTVGLGCLPIRTVLARDKVTRRVRARLASQVESFEAYEIHLGRTTTTGDVTPFTFVLDENGTRPDGAVTPDGRVWGTYLHGLFDAGHVRRVLLGGLQGPFAPLPGNHRELRDHEYTRLAGLLREHVDLYAIARVTWGGRLPGDLA